jgi:hypothetical protein
MPDKSGFPSAVRGTGAFRSGLPAAVRGIPGVGKLSHWALNEMGTKNNNDVASIAILRMVAYYKPQQLLELNLGIKSVIWW